MTTNQWYVKHINVFLLYMIGYMFRPL